MAEEAFRIAELTLQGFNCSQILVILALEAQRKTNPELVRATSGLVAGMGCGRLCGCVTGGCCVLGLYAGRGELDEPENARLPFMLREFVEWFDAEFAERYGGASCDAITEGQASLRLERCPEMVLSTLHRLEAILAENGFAMNGETDAEGA